MDSFATYAYSCHICRREFLLFLVLKTIKKIPAHQCDSYTRMLQMNPPKITSFTCMFSTEVPVASQSAMRNGTFVSRECAIIFFLSATDPKARATVSIPWLKKFCVNVSILKCILKLFRLITIFKMAALDNNYQNCSWFCSFCSWNIIGIIKFSFQRQEKRILQVVLLSKDTIFKMSSPTWMLLLLYQEQ